MAASRDFPACGFAGRLRTGLVQTRGYADGADGDHTVPRPVTGKERICATCKGNAKAKTGPESNVHSDRTMSHRNCMVRLSVAGARAWRNLPILTNGWKDAKPQQTRFEQAVPSGPATVIATASPDMHRAGSERKVRASSVPAP